MLLFIFKSFVAEGCCYYLVFVFYYRMSMSVDSGFGQFSGTDTPVRPITSCSFMQTTTTPAHQPSDALMSPPQQQQQPHEPLPHGIVAWNTTPTSIVPQPVMNTAHNQNMMMNSQQQQQWQNNPNLITPISNNRYNYSVSALKT